MQNTIYKQGQVHKANCQSFYKWVKQVMKRILYTQLQVHCILPYCGLLYFEYSIIIMLYFLRSLSKYYCSCQDKESFQFDITPYVSGPPPHLGHQSKVLNLACTLSFPIPAYIPNQFPAIFSFIGNKWNVRTLIIQTMGCRRTGQIVQHQFLM